MTVKFLQTLFEKKLEATRQDRAEASREKDLRAIEEENAVIIEGLKQETIEVSKTLHKLIDTISKKGTG